MPSISAALLIGASLLGLAPAAAQTEEKCRAQVWSISLYGAPNTRGAYGTVNVLTASGKNFLIEMLGAATDDVARISGFVTLLESARQRGRYVTVGFYRTDRHASLVSVGVGAELSGQAPCPYADGVPSARRRPLR